MYSPWWAVLGPERANGHHVTDAEQIAEFRKLPPDWDGYGADPISEKAIAALEAIAVEGLASTLVPTSGGGLMRTWNASGRFEAIVMDIEPDGTVSIYVSEDL